MLTRVYNMTYILTVINKYTKRSVRLINTFLSVNSSIQLHDTITILFIQVICHTLNTIILKILLTNLYIL